MSIRLRRLSSFLVFLLTAACAAPPVTVRHNRPAFNQLAVSGNACGPAALLNAFRFGSRDWQQVVAAVPGGTDKECLAGVLRNEGARPSQQLSGRTRWSRAGINVTDLAAVANDLAAGRSLPRVEARVLHAEAGESSAHLLTRSHDILNDSLRHGLPPVVSVRRQVLRKSPVGAAAWITIESHFITLTRVMGYSGESFAFEYLDPWGGRKCYGTFRTSPVAGLGLEAVLPSTPVGRRLVRPGEETLVTLSAAVGQW